MAFTAKAKAVARTKAARPGREPDWPTRADARASQAAGWPRRRLRLNQALWPVFRPSDASRLSTTDQSTRLFRKLPR